MLIAVSSTEYFFYDRSINKRVDNKEFVQKKVEKIVLRTNHALLTPENGELILFNNQKYSVASQQSGVSVRKLNDGHLVYEMKETLTENRVLNTVRTPKSISVDSGVRLESLAQCGFIHSIPFCFRIN